METYKQNNQDNWKIHKTFVAQAFLLGTLILLLGLKSQIFVYANTEVPDTTLTNLIYPSDSTKERISYGPKVITIKRGTDIFNIFTTQTDIHDVLREQSIQLDENEFLTTSTPYLVNGSIVRIIRVTREIVERPVNLPYEEEVIKTEKYFRDEEHILQEGVLGLKIQRYVNYYEDGVLITSEFVSERVEKGPIRKIIEIGTSMYSLSGIELRGYNCPYWYGVVDTGPYTEEERRWLKYIMYCESGCNAESNKSSYKGLFQWSPYWWNKQFTENIFDGYAQLKHTIEKYRAGESTRANQWPACHAKYRTIYPL